MAATTKTLLFHYAVLIVILGIGLWSVLTFRYHPLGRPLSIIGLSLGYVLWGIVHHSLMGNLHRQVVLEYLGLSLLGGVIISFLL